MNPVSCFCCAFQEPVESAHDGDWCVRIELGMGDEHVSISSPILPESPSPHQLEWAGQCLLECAVYSVQTNTYRHEHGKPVCPRGKCDGWGYVREDGKLKVCPAQFAEYNRCGDVVEVCRSYDVQFIFLNSAPDWVMSAFKSYLKT